MYRFKLLRGVHQQTDVDPNSSTHGETRTYKRGDTVLSEFPLDDLHGTNRFQNLDKLTGEDAVVLKRRISQLEAMLAQKNVIQAPSESDGVGVPEDKSSRPETPQDDGLDEMSLEELRTFAKSMDLSSTGTKKELVRTIRSAAQ